MQSSKDVDEELHKAKTASRMKNGLLIASMVCENIKAVA